MRCTFWSWMFPKHTINTLPNTHNINCTVRHDFPTIPDSVPISLIKMASRRRKPQKGNKDVRREEKLVCSVAQAILRAGHFASKQEISDALLAAVEALPQKFSTLQERIKENIDTHIQQIQAQLSDWAQAEKSKKKSSFDPLFFYPWDLATDFDSGNWLSQLSSLTRALKNDKFSCLYPSAPRFLFFAGKLASQAKLEAESSTLPTEQEKLDLLQLLVDFLTLLCLRSSVSAISNLSHEYGAKYTVSVFQILAKSPQTELVSLEEYSSCTNSLAATIPVAFQNATYLTKSLASLSLDSPFSWNSLGGYLFTRVSLILLKTSSRSWADNEFDLIG